MLMDAYRSLSSRLLETRDTCETRDICTFRSVPRTSSTVSWRPATIFVFLAPVRCKVAGKCHENASRFKLWQYGKTQDTWKHAVNVGAKIDKAIYGMLSGGL